MQSLAAFSHIPNLDRKDLDHTMETPAPDVKEDPQSLTPLVASRYAKAGAQLVPKRDLQSPSTAAHWLMGR